MLTATIHNYNHEWWLFYVFPLRKQCIFLTAKVNNLGSWGQVHWFMVHSLRSMKLK